MKQRVCINDNTQMLKKCLPLSLTKKTSSFFLPLVFIWLLILMTDASLVYGLSIPYGLNFSFPDFTTQTEHQPSRVLTTIFQPSYMLPVAILPILLPPPPSSFVIPTGVTPQMFPSSIFLSQNANHQLYNFERGQQVLQLFQNRIEEQQMLQQQQQQQLGNSGQQQKQLSPYLLPSLVNSNEPQKQTINDENRQCINNICTIQSTQCTNGVCTTTTTNDNGNTHVNTQLCSSGSNSASCSVRQTQTTQCTGDGVCTITQTECINEICITNIARTF